jgi:hypothetical protein
MRNTFSKVVFTSLAAVTIGLAALGSVAPASADVYSYRNGQTPAAFASTGTVRLGLSPASPPAENFRAQYAPSGPSPASCSPVITRHQKTDTYSYPAGCPAF